MEMGKTKGKSEIKEKVKGRRIPMVRFMHLYRAIYIIKLYNMKFYIYITLHIYGVITCKNKFKIQREKKWK